MAMQGQDAQKPMAPNDVGSRLDQLEKRARDDEKPLPIETVLREEYEAITGRPAAGSDYDEKEIIQAIHGRNFSALCLSGGGIRSATFNLGILQALAREKLLQRFNYLSTVSGGGYVGSWLSSWIARGGCENVCSCLGLGHDPSETKPIRPLDNEPEPIHHLRSFSRYLSPRVGLFSADTWTLVAAYLRNLLLTWTVLLPALAALAAIPLIAASTLRTIAGRSNQAPPLILGAILLVGLLAAVQAVQFVHRHRPHIGDDVADTDKKTSKRPDQASFLALGLGPIVFSGICLTTAWLWVTHLDTAILTAGYAMIPEWIPLHRFRGETDPGLKWAFWWPMVYLGAVVHFVGWVLSGRARKNNPLVGRILEGVFSVPTGAACGLALGVAAWFACPWPSGPKDIAMYTAFALPTFGALLLFAGDLHLGFVSTVPRHADDAEREWAARFNAWVFIVTAVWMTLSALTVIIPSHISSSTSSWIRWSSLGTYALGTLASWLGFSAKTGSSSGTVGTGVSKALKSLSPSVTLFVATAAFCLLLTVLLAEADAWIVRAILCRTGGPLPSCPEHFDQILIASPPQIIFAVALVMFLFSIGAGFAIDMNKFSLHGLYRMRLIRAYLGASRSREERHEDPFIGFDASDNIHMRDLRAPLDERRASCDDELPRRAPGERPFHVVNVALNLVHGSRLAWQDRKAESFTISPLHAGNFRLGYRRTSPSPAQRALELALAGPEGASLFAWSKRKRAPRYYGGRCGVSLGTAMAISGAAASPNMGYHSSATVTFLMTLFNARLGWWLGNPSEAGEKVYSRNAPGVSLFTLWKELFGLTDDKQSFVYLSDGGHFDNLGLYEMIVRRCRFILVCDASADKDCNLADLGNAMRQIRADMQVPIEFEDENFKIQRRSIDGKIVSDGAYYAKAKICYSAVDAPEGIARDEADRYDGTLIYVKPSFYGKEPRDVYNYAIQSPTFPHESTANQFFGESQFESYRALGEYIGRIVCREAEIARYLRGPATVPQGQGLPGAGAPRVRS